MVRLNLIYVKSGVGRVMRTVRAIATDSAAKRSSSIAVLACAEYSTCFNFQLSTVKFPKSENLSKTS